MTMTMSLSFTELSSRIAPILDSGIALELKSAPGRGKSDFVTVLVDSQAARTGQEWGFAEMFLATQNPTDLAGLQFKGTMEYKGRTVAIADPTLPIWMLTKDGLPLHHYPRGILFLDEYGQGDADTKRASAQLLLKGEIGKWKLPPGWSVIAASNRGNDRSGVTKDFDFVINRRLEVHIRDDVQAWEKWAWKAGVNPLFIHYASQNPNIVFADGVPDKQGPWCTPRSLVMCSNLLTRMAPNPDEPTLLPTDSVSVTLASGLIGEAAAAQLFATIRLAYEMPSYDDIVKKPKTTRVPEKPDAAMLVTFQLASRVTEDEFEHVIEYVERMPQEYAFLLAKGAVTRDPNLVNTEAFGQWTVRNAALVNAIMA
jgi:hypothetical protein